jgi:hypothetical protein
VPDDNDVILTDWIETQHNQIFFPIADTAFTIVIQIPDGFTEDLRSEDDWIKICYGERDVTTRFIRCPNEMLPRPTLTNLLKIVDLVHLHLQQKGAKNDNT